MVLAGDIQNFGFLKKKITEIIGFDCSQYSDSFLTRRVDVRLRATNISSYMEYSKRIWDDHEERDLLHKELTINVTNFFRDREMWLVLMEELIPLLVKLKNEKVENTIKIWSAGCSSGEEPLSVAICLLETLGPDLKGFNVSILGSDRKPEIIKSAKSGIYDKQQFNEMPKKYLSKYFDELDNDTFKAKDMIKGMIKYELRDILENPKPRGLDIIFCRNTVIYFNTFIKPQLYMEFYESLNHGGFFIMGKTESLQGSARQVFQSFHTRDRIYVKE